MLNLAIIGAGICGLTVAKGLQHVANVKVFEKSRGLGGRMATRYTENYQFDHGVSYFSASNEDFLRQLQVLNMIESWYPRCIQFPEGKTWQDEVFVSSPRMNSWAKYLALDLSVELNTRVERLAFEEGKWVLFNHLGLSLGSFDGLICTVPWPQAKLLLSNYFVFDFPQMASQKIYMLGYDENLRFEFDVALFSNSCIDKIVVDSAKPGRSSRTSVVIYTYQDESEGIDTLDILQDYLPLSANYLDQHFWRYAQSGLKEKRELMKSKDLKCVVGGDWLQAVPGVEASYLVAQDMIEWMLGIV